MYREEERLMKIVDLLIESDNMKELILNPLHNVYNIEQKKGNLREIYTADLNSKLRLYMKPCAEYPYINLEEIVEIDFIKIDDKHYGEG